MQGDAFSQAVLEGGEVPVPLEDAIANMAVIEAVFRSAESGTGRLSKNNAQLLGEAGEPTG